MKIIKYEASWCQPCKNMEDVAQATFKQLVTEPEYEKIDVDELPEEERLENKIMSVPTFIIYNSKGQELDRQSGSQTQTQFKEWIERYM